MKLSLLFFCSPFDKDDQSSSASTVNKAPTVNKRFSTYNQSPPDTPSLREQAFYVSLSICPILLNFHCPLNIYNGGPKFWNLQ